MKNIKLINVKSIKIKNLFEIFNYDIQYPENENVLIITGPNGFGKTQVLNIIFNLFNRKFSFFKSLVFDKITVFLNNTTSIEIFKEIKEIKDKNPKTELHFLFKKENEPIEDYVFNPKANRELLKTIERYLPLSRIDEDSWIDDRTEELFTLEEIIEKFSNRFPDSILRANQTIKTDTANDILNAIDVHLIREQRLFKKVSYRERHFSRSERSQNIMTETIQTYSDELKSIIDKKI